jgi:hypothetical protein
MEIKAPEDLEKRKRMLQESVDSLFDNTRKASAVKTESNRPLKSLSDLWVVSKDVSVKTYLKRLFCSFGNCCWT